MELYIKDSCEAALITTLHPGAAVSINVQELQDCGGVSGFFYFIIKIFHERKILQFNILVHIFLNLLVYLFLDISFHHKCCLFSFNQC